MSSDWQPSADTKARQARATLLRQIRDFFYERGVLEVETPLLCQHTVTDATIDTFAVDVGNGSKRYLQSSPEYAMKRLLASGSGPIYQIAKAFRQEETTSEHNPEFTMLEWYRPGWSDADLRIELDSLIQILLKCPPACEITYQEACLRAFDLNPLTATTNELQDLIQTKAPNEVSNAWLASGRNALLSFCFHRWVEPTFPTDRPIFVTHYPASQAALAKLDPSDKRVARRFELYYRGLELANGFDELQGADEQIKRFETDQKIRTSNKKSVPTIDLRLIAALESGLPSCAGVAVGLDRLLMCQTESPCPINTLLNFPWDRA